MTACENRPRYLQMAEVMARVRDMQRDEELIRSLMFEMEDSPDWVVHLWVSDDGDEDADLRYYHARLLADEGFLEVSGNFSDHFCITNQGHDFIQMMRQDGLWHQMKAKAAEVPVYSLRLLFEIGHAMLKQKLSGLLSEGAN